MHFSRTRLITPLLLGSVAIVVVASPVSAATAELSSVKGIATTKDVEVSAKIIRDGQPIQGEKGSFSFKNPISGQSCSTSNQVSDAEGWIKGTCSSASSGQYEVVFIPENGSQQSLFVTFEPNNSPPTPSPSPSPSVSPSTSPSPSPSPSVSSSPTPSPSPSVSPSPTPSPTPTPTPSPTPSPSASVKPSPTPSATPKASPKPSPSPSPELDEEEGEAEAVLAVETSSPKPSSSPQAEVTENEEQSGSGYIWILLVGGVLLGLGVPVGWYVLESNPELKAKLLSRFTNSKNK